MPAFYLKAYCKFDPRTCGYALTVQSSRYPGKVVVGPENGPVLGGGLGCLAKGLGKVAGPGSKGASSWIDQSKLKNVPGHWGEGIPNQKGVGTRWFDPANPKGTTLRIDKGNPAHKYPSQQVDHVRVTENGKIIGRGGEVFPPGTKVTDVWEQAHIPLDEWITWRYWNRP
ncbi:hypothetical protein [Amycolatopsis sp. GA6-003]|uniref:hypothetical protein n=1 Tax=Amycolatopsis sp. GA6-003 TaxID=2652444 RepID=UPI003916CF8B